MSKSLIVIKFAAIDYGASLPALMSSEEKFKKKFDASRALSNSDLGPDQTMALPQLVFQNWL